jgi:hypothetical protein
MEKVRLQGIGVFGRNDNIKIVLERNIILPCGLDLSYQGLGLFVGCSEHSDEYFGSTNEDNLWIS